MFYSLYCLRRTKKLLKFLYNYNHKSWKENTDSVLLKKKNERAKPAGLNKSHQVEVKVLLGLTIISPRRTKKLLCPSKTGQGAKQTELLIFQESSSTPPKGVDDDDSWNIVTIPFVFASSAFKKKKKSTLNIIIVHSAFGLKYNYVYSTRTRLRRGSRTSKTVSVFSTQGL